MRVVWLAALLALAAGFLRGGNEDVARAIDSIQAAIESGDQQSAARMIADALARYPHEAGLLNLRGVIHAQRSELAEARADFQQAVHFEPGLTPAWQNLARACQMMTDRDPAAMACAAGAWEHVLHALPENTEARMALATVLEWQGEFGDSLGQMEKLPAEDAARAPSLALRCADLAGLHRAAEAAAAAERLAKSAEFSEADVLSILPVLESTHSDGLIVMLAGALDSSGKASVASLQRLAVAYEHLNRLADARQTLERVAVAEPNNTAHLMELARIAYLAHDLEGAIGYLGHARALTPKDGRIHFLFGLIALEMNLPVEARRSLDQALAIAPANPEYNYAMGALLLTGAQAAEALPYLKKYVAARPADPRGHFALGAAEFESMNYEQCRAEMQGISKAPQTEAGAAYFLGRVERVEENFEAALADLNRAIKLAPSFGEAHTEIARVYQEQGKLAEARAAIDHAIALDPDNYQANLVLLAIMRLTGDPGAEQQKARLATLDEARSRRRELLRRTIEVRPY